MPEEKPMRAPSQRFGVPVLLVLAALLLAEVAGLAYLLDGPPPGLAPAIRLALGISGTVFVLLYFRASLLPVLRGLRFGITVLACILVAASVGTLFPQEDQGNHARFLWPTLPVRPMERDPTARPTPAALGLQRASRAPMDAVERALAEAGGDFDAATELIGFWGTFVQAESAFIWNLLHPLARRARPPSERGAARRWLAERGLAEPDAVLSRILIGEDLEAHTRIFGARAGHEEWRRSTSVLRAAVAEAGAETFYAENREFMDQFFHAARALGLTRIWHAHWFTALLFLLALSLALNLPRPGRFTARKFGFWLTHGGVLLLLLGGATSRLLEERGRADLTVGEVVDHFAVSGPAPGSVMEARFRERLTLELADFKADPNHRLLIGVRRGGALQETLPAGAMRDGYMRSERFRPGERFDLLPGPDGQRRWEVEVLSFTPRVAVKTEWEPAEEGRGRSVALLTDSARASKLELSARPGMPGLRFFPDGKRLALVALERQEEFEAWSAGQGLDGYGHLRLRFADGEWVRVPLEPGVATTLESPEGPLQVHVWRVMQSFDVETWGGRAGIFGERLSQSVPLPDPSADQETNRALAPERPAVALVLDGPRGTGGLYVFSDEMAEIGSFPVPGHALYPGLEARLEFDRVRAPARERLVLVVGPEQAVAVRSSESKPTSVTPLADGTLLEFGEHAYRLERLLRDVRLSMTTEPVTADGNLFHEDPASARLRVSGPHGKREVELVTTTARQQQRGEVSPWEALDFDENLVLRLVEQREMPREWLSRLVVRRLDLPRARSADHSTLVFPILEQAPWELFLAQAREAGADLSALEPFRTPEARKNNLEALDWALEGVIRPKNATFWRERLAPELCLTLGSWVRSSRAAPVGEGVIRVNAPLVVGTTGLPGWLLGYQYGQSNANVEDPDYSGIQVIWDPGVFPVRVGLVITALGTILVFLLLPMRRGFRRKDEA